MNEKMNNVQAGHTISIAIISDIHANLPALQTVLADIRNRNIDQIYCLGDLVDFAPWGNEVIGLFRERHIPCLLGNHDERIAFDLPVIPLPHHDAAETAQRFIAIDHSKNTITDDNKQWLSGLPYQLELTFRTGPAAYKILLVHASPESNDEYIYETYPGADLLSRLGNDKIDALVMGHTHLPYVKTHADTLFINCGSIGRSKEPNRNASYCLLRIDASGIHPEIIRLDYPLEHTAAAIYNSAIPDFYGDFLLQRL